MAAMTKNQINLIEAIVENDMPKARLCASACVAEDSSKKNEWECKRLAKLLDPIQHPELKELPWKINGMLEVEYPVQTFQMNRYYLSPREGELFARIDRNRKVCKALMQMRIMRANTTLLYGASGTGKTTFGRFLAAMFGLPFYYVNFSRLIDGLMGKTSQNLAEVFDYVRTVPCVLMLDEIDTVSTQRKGASDGTGGEINRITVTLMQEFDKLQNMHIVLAATNRLDIIDTALLRRFSRVHEITVPEDEIEASRIMKLLLDDCHVAYNREELIEFCRNHEGKPQAWFINTTIDRIVKAIELRQVLSEGGNADLMDTTISVSGAFSDGGKDA